MRIDEFFFTVAANSHENPSHKIPELPNFISLLSGKFADTIWGTFLHQWESIIFSVIVAIVVSIVFSLGARHREILPSRLQNALEFIVETLRDLIVGILGPDGAKYVPFLGSLFIYLLSMNLFGLIPLMKSPSSSLNITVAQAICVFLLVQYLNIKNMGFFGFLYHMAGSPKTTVEWLMVPLLFPIELLTQVTRPITLAFRLFGNIFGEDILIGYFALLGVSIIPFLPLQTPFLFLALFTSIIQAFVFTLLATIYILLSIPHADEHEEEKHYTS